MRRRLVALTVVPLLLLWVAACGEDSGDGGDSASGGVPGVEVSGEYGAGAEVSVEEPLELEETRSEVLVAGDGNEVVEGQQALLHLTVWDATEDKKVLSTYDEESGGAPQSVQMVDGQFFASVVDATVGESVGSRIVVAAVPEDAFGAQGNEQFGIAPDDDVVFVVDVMSVEPTDVLDGPEGEPNEGVADDLPDVEEEGGEVTGISFADAPKRAPKELEVVTLVEGDGPEVGDDSLVTFDYLGQVWGQDEVFDESYSSEPRTFPVGVGGLIPAWDEAIVGAKRGSRLLIIAPPDTAYGEQGSPPSIPPSSTLAFVVDVLGVDEAP